MMYYDMAAQQDDIEQNVEARQLEEKENDIRSLTQPAHGEPLHFLRSTFRTKAGDNFYYWNGFEFIKPDSYAFVNLTEVDPNTNEPNSFGTVKYRLSSVSPKLYRLDLKFEAWNGAEGIMTRADVMIYTFT
jgi:hypothetical protein